MHLILADFVFQSTVSAGILKKYFVLSYVIIIIIRKSYLPEIYIKHPEIGLTAVCRTIEIFDRLKNI